MPIPPGKRPALHITPQADYIEHESNPDCVCGPTVEEYRSGRLYRHHSLDGREFREKKTDG